MQSVDNVRVGDCMSYEEDAEFSRFIDKIRK